MGVSLRKKVVLIQYETSGSKSFAKDLFEITISQLRHDSGGNVVVGIKGGCRARAFFGG